MKTKAKTEEAPPRLTPKVPERFNETWLAKVKVVPPHREGEAFDGHIAGLGLRVYATGVKSFYFKNNRFRDPIGRWPGVTLQAARKAAEARNGKIALGIDLVEEREKAIAKKNVPKAITLKELVELNKTIHLITKSAAHRARAPRTIEMTFAPLMKTPVTRLVDRVDAIEDAITAAEVNRGRAPAVAGATNFRTLVRWAAKKRIITRAQVPEFVIPASTPDRDRVLSQEELHRIHQASTGTRGAIVRLIMYTGARRSEIGALTWDMVKDLDNPELARLELPRAHTKNRTEHVIPLSGPARDLLRTIPRDFGQRFAFAGVGGRTPGKVPFDDYARLKQEVDSRVGEPGIPDWRLHDFRRSLVTHMSGEPFDYDETLLDRLLGHAPSGLRGSARVYQKQKHLSARRRVLSDWADFVMRAPEKVVELSSARARKRAAP